MAGDATEIVNGSIEWMSEIYIFRSQTDGHNETLQLGRELRRNFHVKIHVCLKIDAKT